MGFADDVSNRDLSWFVFGIVAGLVLTDYLGPIWAFALEIVVIAVIQVRRFNLYEKAVDRYSEPVREKGEALGEKFWSFLDWFLDATEGYGKYVIGGFFIYVFAVLLLIPELPYRWYQLVLLIFAAVDWYVFDLRYLRGLQWRLRYRPGLLVGAVLIVAAYLYGAGQLQPLLENYLDFLQGDLQ